MIKNPKECWWYAIQTKHLREPAESFEVLKYKIQHPTKSYAKIAEELNLSYNSIRQWAFKYFYRDRINAYNKEMNEVLTAGITNYKLKQIESAAKRADTENGVLDNELYFLKKDLNTKIELEKNKESIPEYLEQRVEHKEKEYWNNRLNKLRGDKLIDDIPTMQVPLEEISDDLINENPAIQMFIKAMEENRNENHRS